MTAKEYQFEKVTYVPSPLANGEYIPRVATAVTNNANNANHTNNTPTNANTTNNTAPPATSTSTSTSTSTEIISDRDFQNEDMNRVLDYDHLPDPPPPDATLGHLEFELDDDGTTVIINDDDNTATPTFPKRYCCLRGSFIFYYDMDDVKLDNNNMSNANYGGMGGYGGGNANSIKQGGEAKFTGPPLGVVPLERTSVEFPAGGRRVFREHAKTNARNGYEMMIRHIARNTGTNNNNNNNKGGDENEASSKVTSSKRRAPAYFVMDSLGQRDAWADAIRIRSDVYMKDTKLRAAGALANNNHNAPPTDPNRKGGIGNNALAIDTDIGGIGRRGGRRSQSPSTRLDGMGGMGMGGMTNRRGPMGIAGGGGGGIGGEISVLAGVIDPSEQKEIDQALHEFGRTALFNEDEWVNSFFQSSENGEIDAMNMCEQLERWQSSIKKGLRGAVLEQYEYFVEASREMTIMGREVAALKDLVKNSVDTFESMKNIDFDLDVGGEQDLIADHHLHVVGDDDDDEYDDPSNDYSSDEDDGDDHDHPADEQSRSRKSSSGRSGNRRNMNTNMFKDTLSPTSSSLRSRDTAEVEIPSWLDDSVEEISAFVKECRYTDASDLLLKTKSEVAGILDLNDRLTEKKISKKQQSTLHRMQRSIDELSNRLCERLSEGLRRKNEALKQTAKKERADPLTAMTPLVSPIALNDDSTALHLLVKLGRPQDAATAYSTRRSLLLNECLHERPICNTNTTNNVDVVIYAAQLSHSFFNCLAISVEGFLDLFSDLDKGNNATDDHSETSSINTSSLKGVPANALAATCLWCDSELSKFASVFGSKVLGNLTLSPRDGASSNRITERITQFETVADISHLKNQLRAAEEMGEYAAAGKLRKKIAIQEQEEKDGNLGHKVIPSLMSNTSVNNKERKTAIEIASKCIDQTFEFATEFLNTIGLPLTPRLAEYLRTRLKGTEAEIATEIEHKWEHIIFDWKLSVSSATYDAIRKSTSED